jgi:hypothetical protein
MTAIGVSDSDVEPPDSAMKVLLWYNGTSFHPYLLADSLCACVRVCVCVCARVCVRVRARATFNALSLGLQGLLLSIEGRVLPRLQTAWLLLQ